MSQTRLRRPQASRRGLTKAAVWAVPAVVVAAEAPAFAVSLVQCSTLTPVTISYGTAGTAFTSITASGVTMTGSSTDTNINTAAPRNVHMKAVNSDATGGSNIGELGIDNQFLGIQGRVNSVSADGSSANMTVTLSFSVPVYGLKFTIVDIDATTTYDDAVALSSSPSATPTATKNATYVDGSGTTASPWTTPYTASGAVDTDWDNPTGVDAGSSGRGNVAVTYSSETGLDSITIKYWSVAASAGTGTQAIFLSPMTFYTEPCT